MLARQVHRFTAALFVVLSLLCSQFALASYVCPGDSDSAMAQMMTAGQPCEGMDQLQPTLCHQHATATTQSFEVVKLPTPSLPMVVQVLQLPLVLSDVEATALPLASAPERHPPPAPVFLATLRLRV